MSLAGLSRDGRGRQLAEALRGANGVIVANAGSLLGTTAAMSALGYVYWWVAARHFSPTQVGLAAASVSAMLLLANVGVLGLGTLLINELPRQPGREATLIGTALLTAGPAAAALGLLFALLAPFLTPDLGPLGASPTAALLFALGVMLTAVGSVLDRALLGLLRGELQFGRNVVFAASKVAALVLAAVWLAGGGGLTIYATWVSGQVVSLVALAGLAARGVAAFRPDWRLLRGLGRVALGHHALNLALQVPNLALPVLVTITLSATTNAYFYLAWMVLTLLFAGPSALSTALHPVGVRTPRELAARIRFTLGLALGGGLLVNLVALPAAGLLMGLFGQTYAEQGATSLRILCLAIFPDIVKDHYVAVCRIQGRIFRGAMLAALGGTLQLLLGALGAHLGGLAGLSAGLVVAMYFQAVLMVGPVYRTARSGLQ